MIPGEQQDMEEDDEFVKKKVRYFPAINVQREYLSYQINAPPFSDRGQLHNDHPGTPLYILYEVFRL
ncbi:MAG: hypothetical protein KDD36_02440 [Flavobacteriales bacterium]|nr:hypothetical protein [Flavobacteriales bacterium]